jgi:hypothetical protein
VGRSTLVIAEALLAAGELPAALATAREAIAICRRWLRGNFEAEALGVVARALLRIHGREARGAAEAALDEAAALVERTGARTLAPTLWEWRAELAAVLGDSAGKRTCCSRPCGDTRRSARPATSSGWRPAAAEPP